MKRIFSFLLAVVLLVSALPVAYAADTQDYSLGTAVVYTANEEANEKWTVAVPAKLAPGTGGTVTLEGYWPSTKTITVTAQESVKLTNSINANDTKTLAVDFKNGISAAGSNTEKQKFTETVSVEAISNALFGTWDGHFYYTVGTANAPVLEGDGQVFFTALPETLSFRSTAPMSEFQEVKVNGVTVDPSNYTVTEGSTIITLHEDYLMTLGAEAHQITVVSDSGSPSAGFSVRDTITYEEGDYIYTIMQDGFETLEEARAYYRIYAENQFGMTSDEIEEAANSEDFWAYLTAECWVGLTEDTFASPYTTLNEARAYYKTLILHWAALHGNNTSWSEMVELGYGGDEEALWEEWENNLGIGLTANSFIPQTTNSYWSVVVNDRTKMSYGEMCEELLGHAVEDISMAFTDCTNMVTAPVIPSGVTTIGFTTSGGAFSGCTSLESIFIPANVKIIGSGAFEGCTNLKKVTFAENSHLTNIGSGAFSECSSLASITIPENVTTIGSAAFRNCASIENITIPSGVTTISSNLFRRCTSLDNIVISANVTYIDELSVSESSLTAINFQGTMEQWNAIAKADSSTVGTDWNCACGEIIVTCTDGTVIIPAYGS